MRIRDAVPADAEAMIHVHYAAVHKTAAAFYQSEILEAWSCNPDEARYQWMRQVISQPDHIVLVAEDKSGIGGFGIVVVSLSELRALYIHPTAGRKGIGMALLHELETRAVNQGVTCLGLNASINGQQFYLRSGYEALAPGKQDLAGGREMDCIKMEKRL